MDEKKPSFGPGMEGEGNKTADKRYRDGATAYAQSGQVEANARAAERDLEEHPEAFEQAEQAGKGPSAGDLEGDLQHPRHDADIEPDDEPRA